MKVGDLVRREYDAHGYGAGIIVQMREGAFENQPLIQVFWPHHNGQSGWVDSKDMELISESR